MIFKHWSQIIFQLTRIADALEKANAAQDFSKEDSAVLAATKAVEEAKGRIPPRVTPTI